MDTQSFLAALERSPSTPLVFELPDGGAVAPGYHVTEVTHASYRSMDCGGQQSAWQETLVQLKGPSACDAPEHMPAGKFLAIYRRAAASVPVGLENELRVEYGDADRAAVRYRVEGLEPDGGALRVRLAAPQVACKPQLRRQTAADELPVAACC